MSRGWTLVLLGLIGCGPSGEEDGGSPAETSPPGGTPTAAPSPEGATPSPGVATPPIEPSPTAQRSPTPSPTAEPSPGATPSAMFADVEQVETSPSSEGYTFIVTVRSPDLGCDQYADWWEVLSLEGRLLYRRTLDHSHVDEQPFTRSGGPVELDPTEEVYVRAHMNTTGYGGGAMRGSVDGGFVAEALEVDFAAQVESFPPQPSACAF